MNDSTRAISPDDDPRNQSFRVALTSGEWIGHYRLLQPLGGGGQGEVWLAEQQSPIRRKVAIKVLRQRDLKPAMIARFEAERQALAMMDHPHIAKIYDVGVDPSIGPYFAMEFCHGRSITKFCDERRLSIPKRLELFQQVCQAVQHAHQKGIIHRDIKPSNVLVIESDAEPNVKVIDFGLAKAMESQMRLTDKSLFTEIGQLIGTYKYMSPEQAAANPIDIDTRTDIYSLGVLLYELLTGTTPVDDRSLVGKALVDVVRMIREQDPKIPSRRISDSQDSLSSVSNSRQSDPRKLPNALQGDLDWIVMKSIEKDRSRRYATPNHLAEDIQRHLKGEPVNAAPPSKMYRIRKVLWRNRMPAAVASLFLVCLLGGIVGTSIGFYNSFHAAQLSQSRLIEVTKAKEAEEQQRLEAEKQRAIAMEQEKRANDKLELSERVLEFLLEDLLAQASPSQQGNSGHKADPNLTVREAVKRAADSIESRFDERPIIQARIREVIGETQRQLGEYASSIEQLEQAVKLFAANVGETDMQHVECLRRLALVNGDSGRIEKCQELLEKVLALSPAGPDDPFTLTTLSDLAIVYGMRGEFKKASDLEEKTLARQKTLLGLDHDETLIATNNLAVSYGIQFNYAKSIELLEEVAARQAARPNGEEAANTLMTRRNLATGYREIGRVDEALELLQRTLATQRTVFGSDSIDVAISMSRLAAIHCVKKDFAVGKKAYEDSQQILLQRMSPTHPEVLLNRAALAMIESEQGNTDKAIELLQPICDAQRESLGESHPHTLASQRNLASFYFKKGDYNESIQRFQKAIELMNGPKHDNWNLYHAMARLGRALLANEQLELAKSHLTKGYEGLVSRKPTIPFSHRMIVGETIDDLIQLHTRLNEPDQIKKWQDARLAAR